MACPLCGASLSPQFNGDAYRCERGHVTTGRAVATLPGTSYRIPESVWQQSLDNFRQLQQQAALVRSQRKEPTDEPAP